MPAETPPHAADSMLGEIIADRYLVRAVLGEGGMGRVYRAVQLDLERPVALKLLDPSLARDPRQVARFHREAIAASRLDHPGVAVVHDHGEWEDQLFLVMELLKGLTLRQLLDQQGLPHHMQLVSMLAQVADVLTVAHDTGMVHRDLKPENIMICPGRAGTRRVKVVDFGLASLLGQDDWQHAPDGMLLSGTPRYMSPEQCRGARVEISSDIYSLGVMLYELLCGRPPFGGSNAAEVVLGHLYVPPDPPARKDGVAVHQGLAMLAMEALAKEAAGRPQSAELFRNRLLDAVGFEDAGGAAQAVDSVKTSSSHGLLPTLAQLPGPLRVRIVARTEAAARVLEAVLRKAGIEATASLAPDPAEDLSGVVAQVLQEPPDR